MMRMGKDCATKQNKTNETLSLTLGRMMECDCTPGLPIDPSFLELMVPAFL
jgi:hypothetical protein